MAAATVTAALVRPGFRAYVRRYIAGGVVAPGDSVYIDTNGKVQRANGAGAIALSQGRGIVIAIGVSGKVVAAVGDEVDVVVNGPVTGFSGLTQGAAVYVGVVAGAVDQTPPATTGQFKFALGYAESDVTIFVQPQSFIPIVNP